MEVVWILDVLDWIMGKGWGRSELGIVFSRLFFGGWKKENEARKRVHV
jgi:hypothetical protein